MVLMSSAQPPSGWQAPAMALPNPAEQGRLTTYDEVAGPMGLVVLAWCNHCPFVQHIEHAVLVCANDVMPKGVGFVAIGSNDAAAYPEDAPERMAERAHAMSYPFPYLWDEDQSVATALQACCTPDVWVFNARRVCVYQGRFDGATPGNDVPPDGADLRGALEALLAGQVVPQDQQQPSWGCSIKWRDNT